MNFNVLCDVLAGFSLPVMTTGNQNSTDDLGTILNLLLLPAYSLDLTEDKIILYKYYSTADVLYQAFTFHDYNKTPTCTFQQGAFLIY